MNHRMIRPLLVIVATLSPFALVEVAAFDVGSRMVAEVGRLSAADGVSDDVFGGSIAVDGTTALIAAPWDRENGEFSGSVYVFERGATGWIQQAELVPPDGRPFGLFGYDVALDGDTAVIGALGNAPDWGAVYVFVRRDGEWALEAKLEPADGEPDYLGHAVAVDGDTILAGAPDWNFAAAPGTAYVFSRNRGEWTQSAKLDVPGVRHGDDYGHVVALDGGTAMVGAYGIGPDFRGAVYAFERAGDGWSDAVRLELVPGPVDDGFGFELALDGDTLLVGAPKDARNGTTAGAVHVFERGGGFWTHTESLRPADNASPDWFGRTIALDGGVAVIGAPQSDDNGTWSGSAYVWTRDELGWVERTKIVPRDGAREEGFGFSIGLVGDTALIAAPWDDTAPGRAYVYRLRADRGHAAPAATAR